MTIDYRPLAHYTPARNWMNDPNGLVFHDGTFHLFYQYNPAGDTWGSMSWGHATSTDLVRWHEHPVALACTPLEQVYSGSVVFDRHNSSGLGTAGQPPLVAIYTSVSPEGGQAQALAFSLDGGMRWERFRGNPVLDRSSREFRDPKVFAHTSAGGDTRWIMVAVEAVERQVLVYSSSDLRSWRFESVVGPSGPDDVVWECPDLFPLPVDGDPDRTMWVLLLSTNRVGEVTDSSMSYRVGSFDGHAFVSADDSWHPLDHGRDFYAAVTFSDAPDDRRIALGWAGNWQYAADTPTRPWRGAMSSPRELSLTERGGGLVLRQALPREWRVRAGAEDEREPSVDLEIRSGASTALTVGRHWIAEVEWRPDAGAGAGAVLTIGVLATPGGAVAIVYDAGTETLSLDRRGSGGPAVHAGFATASAATVPLRDGRLALTIVVDASIVEVFADDGAVTLTDLVFPPEGADGLVVEAGAGVGRLVIRPLP